MIEESEAWRFVYWHDAEGAGDATAAHWRRCVAAHDVHARLPRRAGEITVFCISPALDFSKPIPTCTR